MRLKEEEDESENYLRVIAFLRASLAGERSKYDHFSKNALTTLSNLNSPLSSNGLLKHKSCPLCPSFLDARIGLCHYVSLHPDILPLLLLSCPSFSIFFLSHSLNGCCCLKKPLPFTMKTLLLPALCTCSTEFSISILSQNWIIDSFALLTFSFACFWP